MKKLWTFVVALTLLASSAFAAFIQSPIPPSSQENYLLDSDGDGRLDRVDLKFLGSLSKEYVSQMVDSLTFDWLNSAGLVKHYAVGPKQFILDSTYSRRASLDLRPLEKGFAILTEMVTDGDSLGNFKMFLHDGSVFDIPVKDKMAPVIQEIFLKSSRGMSNDSLSIVFSERVAKAYSCENLFESRSSRDSLKHFRKPVSISWIDGTSAQLVFENEEGVNDYLLPGDSIRLTPGCFVDSAAKNPSAENAPFKVVDGFYPLEVHTANMVYGEDSSENLPVFQMLFEKEGANVPNENNWGVAMDVMGPEFENAVRDALGMDHKEKLDLSKLKIFVNVRIYTNLGSFVVATTDEIYGNDPRFDGRPTRLFLKWNLMDGNRRKVGTGAYISNAVLIVSYKDQVVFRNDIHRGPTTQAFGVKRK